MLDRVTWHAVRRFLERVCTVDLSVVEPYSDMQPPDRAVALAFLDQCGIDVDEVKDVMLTDGVRVALATGANVEVKIFGHRMICREGKLVTVDLPRRKGFRGDKHFKEMSKAELRRKRGRGQRRHRGRP